MNQIEGDWKDAEEIEEEDAQDDGAPFPVLGELSHDIQSPFASPTASSWEFAPPGLPMRRWKAPVRVKTSNRFDMLQADVRQHKMP